MRKIPYSLQFRGYVEPLAPSVLHARATAPGTSFVTRIGEHGLTGSFEPVECEEAVLEARLLVAADGSLDSTGTITCGHGNVLRFRTLVTGRLADSPDPHLRQGTVVCAIDGGEGQFSGARGRIASTFVLSDTGELTDNHLGLVFLQNGVADAVTPERRVTGMRGRTARWKEVRSEHV